MTASKEASSYGRASASPSSQADPRVVVLGPADVEQCRGEVAGDDLGADAGGRERGVAAAGRDVEDAVAGGDRGGVDEDRPELGDHVGDDAVVVAQRPHAAVLGLQLSVGVGVSVALPSGSCVVVLMVPPWFGWVVHQESRGRRAATSHRSVPAAVLNMYWPPSRSVVYWRSGNRPALRGGCDVQLWPVLSCRQGDGGARRAVDAARRPRAGARQPAVQRAAAGQPADVAGAAVQATAFPRAGRGRTPGDDRRPCGVHPHPGGPGARAGRDGAREPGASAGSASSATATSTRTC